MGTPNNKLLKSVAANYWALPLFASFDLRVEFEARWKWATNQLGILKRTPEAPLHERIQQAAASAEIEPIVLEDFGSEEIIPPGLVPGTTVRSMGHQCCIGYVGDDILWYLNPGIADDFPDGEIFRGDLILSSAATALEQAQRHFADQLGRLREVVEMQSVLIEQFNRELPSKLFDWWRGCYGGVVLRETVPTLSALPAGSGAVLREQLRSSEHQEKGSTLTNLPAPARWFAQADVAHRGNEASRS